MIRYVLARILLMIPTFIVVCLVSFYLYHNSGSDPVHSLLALRGVIETEVPLNYEEEYRATAKELNRDLPLFYVSMVPNYFPKNLNYIVNPREKELARNLLILSKDWAKTKIYIEQLKNLQLDLIQRNGADELYSLIQRYYSAQDKVEIDKLNNVIEHYYQTNEEEESKMYVNFLSSQSDLLNTDFSFFYPVLHFHGSRNQFHKWFSSILRADFGRAMVDGRPVLAKIKKALMWSVSLALLSIFFSTIFSLPLGFYTALYSESKLNTLSSLFLYFVFSIPIFWLATLMIVFFTTDDFGNWTNIFPSVGLIKIESSGVLQTILSNLKLLILPTFCLIFSYTAYLYRQVRLSILEQRNKDYFLAAVSKGMSIKSALFKHAFPNALFPISTILIGAIPAAMSGSLVIEIIFNIPGMGRLLFNAIFNDDWNTISAIIIFVSMITMIFYLIGDIVYAKLNPKISYS